MATAAQNETGLFRCGECGARFNSMDQLREHADDHHMGPNAKVYQCPDCEERFHTGDDWKAHRALRTVYTQ